MLTHQYNIIEKARHYAANAEAHIHWLNEDQIHFQGNHAEHKVARNGSQWHCDCATYRRRTQANLEGLCAHVVAVEKICGETPFLTLLHAKPQNGNGL